METRKEALPTVNDCGIEINPEMSITDQAMCCVKKLIELSNIHEEGSVVVMFDSGEMTDDSSFTSVNSTPTDLAYLLAASVECSEDFKTSFKKAAGMIFLREFESKAHTEPIDDDQAS